MNLIKLLLLSSLFTTLATATVYEDAEDGTTDGWVVYDNKPAGATITNINAAEASDISDRRSHIIQLKGLGRQNSYQLGARKGHSAWNNTSETVFHWSMNTKEKYKIYVYALTKKGYRNFTFTSSTRDKGLKKGHRTSYIHSGLGKVSLDGNWHDYVFDLALLLKNTEPDNEIVSINGFRVKGSAFIDDIILNNAESDPYITKEYTENKKYFFSTKSKSSHGRTGTEWFVVESKTYKVTDYAHFAHSVHQTPSYSKVDNVDVFLMDTGSYAGEVLFHTISKKGKFIPIDIKRPVENQENGHIDFMSITYLGDKIDKKISVVHYLTAKGKEQIDIYDVSELPKVQLLSSTLK